MYRVITQIMRATGRPPHAHRDPSRPGRGGDRLDLSIASITNRLMRLRSDIARRITGPGLPAPRGPVPVPPQSWLTPPQAMIGRIEPPVEAFEPDEWAAESRIDAYAQEPGVLIRTPRRPAAIVPEHTPLPARTTLPENVRFTRTPDPILQERRQRAIEAEREAQRQIEAQREAGAAAFAAAEAARLAAEDEARRVEEIVAQSAALAEIEAAEAVPAWRRPFVPPPGVRFFRTPDRPKSKRSPSTKAEPVTEIACDWSRVPDWTDLRGWFGSADDAAIAYWYPQAADEPAPAPIQVRPLLQRADALPAPVYALDRLMRFEQMMVPEAANAASGEFEPRPRVASPLSAMAARAAIRPAGQPIPVVPAEAFVEAAEIVEPLEAPSPSERSVLPARPILLRTPKKPVEPIAQEEIEEVEPIAVEEQPEPVVQRLAAPSRPRLVSASRHEPMAAFDSSDYTLPSLELLALPAPSGTEEVDADELEQNALNLQQTVQDFGVRGDILAVRPGPVVTLYELEPAPGTKSSRVIGLSDDIARSMSAVSARVAVVPGRNVIGIELPNAVRETVYLRELLSSEDFSATKQKLALCLGKNIGGEPIIADLARMPHLLVAGTTGSGKSVAINTMILSLLYRLKPEECRLIMVDPKMLELSIYDGIPHLLSPVVTDPKKAVIALKWAVREMEERYKKMSKVGVRNIDGYNGRMKEAREKGEIITRTIQTGFNRETGEAVFVEEAMELSALPYIVIVVDEMADLMMVAGKDIEGAIQRLAQMARAAGIHLIMATQRPSVDVITGTIKANFPTRISFQVTSKIDSRTILGEMGAEQLLGQGDMLFMAGGGRTTRVHGPFCSDAEVESVVAHLKRQGRPSYLDDVTADDGSSEPEKPGKGAKKTERDEFGGEEGDAPVFDVSALAGEGADLYEQAVAVVLRDQKASTSYIQRRLQIGYNRAASIMERMETEGIVGQANHAGKREILVEGASGHAGFDD